MDFFRILQGGTGVGMSNFDRLWSQKFNDNWPIITLSGSLPLSFLSKGDALTNYIIYGASSGVGDETENLINLATAETFSATNLASEDKWVRYNGTGAVLRVPCDSNTEYTLKYYGESPTSSFRVSTIATDDAPSSSVGSTVTVSDLVKTSGIYQATFTTNSTARYLLFQPAQVVDLLVLCKGPTAPASYIPHGYQIPLTVTSNEQSITTPVYIGSSKLYEEEYLDYESGKVYKKKPNLVSGIIQNASVNSSGKLVYNDALNSAVTPIEQGKTYTMLYARGSGATSNMICGFFEGEDYPELNDTTYNGSRLVWNAEYRTFTAPITGYLVSSCGLVVTDPVVYEGEYPQLAPTDPPVPLPAINTYKGENTLDSTEDVGEVEITGKIKAKENE